MEPCYTKEEISKGLKLARGIFEGWLIEDLQDDQLFEMIELGAK